MDFFCSRDLRAIGNDRIAEINGNVTFIILSKSINLISFLTVFILLKFCRGINFIDDNDGNIYKIALTL